MNLSLIQIILVLVIGFVLFGDVESKMKELVRIFRKSKFGDEIEKKEEKKL